MPEFKPVELAKLIEGKTIKKINHYRARAYMGWNMCIDSIEFTDGSKIEMSGNADEAYIEFYYDKRDEQFWPTEDE